MLWGPLRGKKNKVWDYLNSDKNEDLAQGDGDWEYANEYGSESYYGADGSWGYKNVNGSGSYFSTYIQHNGSL